MDSSSTPPPCHLPPHQNSAFSSLPNSSPSALLLVPFLTLSFLSTKAASFGLKKLVAEEAPGQSSRVNAAGSVKNFKTRVSSGFLKWEIEEINSLQGLFEQVSEMGVTNCRKRPSLLLLAFFERLEREVFNKETIRLHKGLEKLG